MDQSELPPLFVKLSFDKRELTQAKMRTLAVPVCLALRMSRRSGGKKDDMKKQLCVKKDEDEKATWGYYLQCWLEDEGVDLKQLGLNQQDQNLRQRLLVLKWQEPLQ
ncbi:hypothetical protein Patl1_14749 [Pistacia atlantica]|uniref:Uncharacterized protein n=1 Tax=Pistacia atlantica TaxID=434234 RepID=A0ACC1AWT8_9ROSI|nr:hypothetical protein Patl1_14749 [Pistacia atlantica]